MGRPDSTCAGQMLVQHEQLIGKNQDVVVILSCNAFNAIAVVRVPFPSTIATVLVGNPGIALMFPREEGNATSEVVRGRRITVVPPPFISALLARNNHMTVDLWQIVHSVCLAHG